MRKQPTYFNIQLLVRSSAHLRNTIVKTTNIDAPKFPLFWGFMYYIVKIT